MRTDVMEQLQLKAKANLQRVVFPEANEEKEPVLRVRCGIGALPIPYSSGNPGSYPF